MSPPLKSKYICCMTGMLSALAIGQPVLDAEDQVDEILIQASQQNAVTELIAFEKEADQYLYVGSRDLLESAVFSMNDMRRLDPRIVTSEDRGRGRNEGIQLRGLGGNRIQVTLDDVPMGDAIGELVELSMLNGVLVDFGSGSSRSGSGSMAGTVAFQTLRAGHILKPDESDGVQALFFASSLNNSVGSNIRFAHQDEESAYLFAIGVQQKHEREAVGDAHVWPQDITATSALANYEWKHEGGRETSLIIDGFDEQIDTTIRDAYLFKDLADDERNRIRVSLAHKNDREDEIIQSNAHLFVQKIQSFDKTVSFDFGNQDTGFDRKNTSTNDFEQEMLGAQYQQRLEMSDKQRLYFGAETLLTHTEDLQQSRTEINSTGTTFIETPTRSFPVSDGVTAGLFGEIQRDFGQSQDWTFGIGLRYDIYGLDVSVDEAYEASLAGVNAPVDLNDGALTGRINMTRHIDELSLVYGKLSQGYRNGRFDEANHAFTNFSNGYTISPNPELSEETSLGIEFGYKYDDGLGSRVEAVVHYARYNDFISTAFVGTIPNTAGIGPFATLSQFKSVNQDSVDIYGLDLLGRFQFENDMYVRYALSWIEGQDNESKDGIDTLQPLSGQFGIGYRPVSQKWYAEVSTRFATSKSNVERIGAFVPPSWLAVDASCGWAINERTRCDFSIENIGNIIYWEWSDVDSLNESNAQADKDYYAASARHVKVSLTCTW